MGYRSDSIAVSRDMKPLSIQKKKERTDKKKQKTNKLVDCHVLPVLTVCKVIASSRKKLCLTLLEYIERERKDLDLKRSWGEAPKKGVSIAQPINCISPRNLMWAHRLYSFEIISRAPHNSRKTIP